jgi:hypothetical protein
MGTKHNKKRFFIVKYHIKANKNFDEFVELSKKNPGPGKITEAMVVLDLIKGEVVKCELPGIPFYKRGKVPFETVYLHYRKWYADVIDQFIAS